MADQCCAGHLPGVDLNIFALIGASDVLRTAMPGQGMGLMLLGMNTALKNRQILDNAHGVLGIEFLAAAQALDMREMIEDRPYVYGHGSSKAREVIRRYVEFLDVDRPLYPDHNRMKALVASGEILREVEEKVGPLD